MKTKTDSIGLVLVFAALAVLTGCKEEPDTVSLPLLADAETTEITVSSVLLKGMVLAQGGADVVARGFCWSTTDDPTIDDNKMTVGKGIGSFTGRITGLLPGTEYHVRTWATNLEGTSYSLSELIRTPSAVKLASIVTLTPEYLMSATVLAGGDITDIGGGEIIERGVCWNTVPSPTTENSKTVAVTTGAGSGKFTLVLNNLEPGETYYLRAFAVNAAGVSYGSETSFRIPLILGTKVTDFPGETRYHSVAFSIGDRLYLGFGDNGTGWPSGDFWVWDQTSGEWTMLASFPGNLQSPTGFAIGGKGYVFSNSWNELGENEFWEYDPASDRWTQKASLPVKVVRISPVAFSIGLKGYIGMGQGMIPSGNTGDYYDDMIVEYMNDLWEYDQGNDTWTRKADFPGLGRYGAAAFTIGNKGYVGTGATDIFEGPLVTDFWEYDQQSDKWTRKKDFPGSARAFAFGFSSGSRGYIGAGRMNIGPTITYQDLWEWDQASDNWFRSGIIPEGHSAWTGGIVGNNGYFINVPDSFSPVELWTFTLTTE